MPMDPFPGLILANGFFALLAAAAGEAERAAGNRPLAEAVFAGGCFWCMVPPFEKLEGVVSVTSGYTGGFVKNPTYEEVSAGGTGHAEAVRVVYDPEKIGYARLLEVFWHNVDPADAGGQFADRGDQYRLAIFYRDDEQKALAEASKQALEASKGLLIVARIVPAGEFYPAEEYHQDYHKKNPVRYKSYRYGSGRDRRLRKLWGPGEGG